MTSTFLVLLLFAFAELRPALDSLVEAERSFARTSVAKGTKEAFLASLADNSILFRPHAVQGKKWTAENPGPPSQLNWEPEFADIANAGDLGYTTGPWELRRSPPESPTAFGHYVSLWRKQSDGQWKVEVDNGIGHERSAKPSKVETPALAREIAPAKPKRDIDSSLNSIIGQDKIAASGLMGHCAEDVRIYRDGFSPFVGKPAAAQYVAAVRGVLTSTPGGAGISNSADLGYTYGTAEFKPQQPGPAQYYNYLRIWKKQKDGSWKIVLDLMGRAPKP